MAILVLLMSAYLLSTPPPRLPVVPIPAQLLPSVHFLCCFSPLSTFASTSHHSGHPGSLVLSISVSQVTDVIPRGQRSELLSVMETPMDIPHLMPHSLWIGNQAVPEEAAFYTLSYNSQNMVALHQPSSRWKGIHFTATRLPRPLEIEKCSSQCVLIDLQSPRCSVKNVGES